MAAKSIYIQYCDEAIKHAEDALRDLKVLRGGRFHEARFAAVNHAFCTANKLLFEIAELTKEPEFIDVDGDRHVSIRRAHRLLPDARPARRAE
jgi:hypothetical protein